MCSNGIPKRYILSILVFWGFFTMYALRTNLNVAIGAMVKNHTVFIDGVETDKVSQLSLISQCEAVNSRNGIVDRQNT